MSANLVSLYKDLFSNQTTRARVLNVFKEHGKNLKVKARLNADLDSLRKETKDTKAKDPTTRELKPYDLVLVERGGEYTICRYLTADQRNAVSRLVKDPGDEEVLELLNPIFKKEAA